MNYMKSTIPANLIREIIRLHYEKNLSIRKVSESTGVSRNRISRLVHHLNDISIDIQDVKAIKDDIAFFQKLSLTNVSNKSIKPHPDLSWVHSEIKNPHVTLDLLWKEWRETEPNGINYSQFVKVYRSFIKKLPVTMRQRHVPGENLFLDFAGQRIPVYTDSSTEARYAHIFVAVLGYSSYTFACAVWSQTTRNWLSCHVKAFNYFNGTTKYLVPDNLKAAVIKHSKDEILLNSQYQQLASHYETVVLPARPRRPKDKAKVEAGVKLVQRWLLASLRHQKFFSLDELNHALIGMLPRLNERPFKSFPKESRLSRFIEIEQRALVPLPLTPFEPADFRENVKIGSSYMIEHAGNFYSVSYKLVGQKVAVRVTENVIEVFHNNLRVCSHTRLEDFIGEYSINDQHRHPNHKIYSDSSPDKLLAWGEYVGQSVLKHLHYHLFERIDRESNGRKAAYALKREAQNYGEERLEEACAYALSINTYALRSLRSILKTQADKRGGKKNIKNDSSVEHENLRGASYFMHNKES